MRRARSKGEPGLSQLLYNDVIDYLDNKKILQNFHYYMKLRQTTHAWDTGLKFKNISKKNREATWRKEDEVLQACVTGDMVWEK